MITTLEEFKKELLEEAKKQIHTVYGHYQSASGQMFIELYHEAEGLTRYKRGEYDKPLMDDRTLNLEQTVFEYSHAMNLGYEKLFKGTTQDDMDKGNQKRLEALSQAQRDGILGTYYWGNRFFRLSQYGETFTIESGSNGVTASLQSDQPESVAREALKNAVDAGYSKLEQQTAPIESPAMDDLFDGI